MPHSDADIERAATRFAQLADELDPATAQVESTEDLQAIARAVEALRNDEDQLRQAVATARQHGRSWNRIAVALGVTRQAARQRFSG